MVWPFTKQQETKAHPLGAALMVPGGEGWSRPRDRRHYITEGFQLNPIIYRAIKEIVTAASVCPVVVSNGDEMFYDHPALDLLKRPNPRQAWAAWLEEMLVNDRLLGEMACTHANWRELWPVSPLNIKVKPGDKGFPAYYEFETGTYKQRFRVNPSTGVSDLFFAKTFNPIDYWRGQSPLMAAGVAGDLHNAGLKWNYSLLRNGARPSGLVELPGAPEPGIINSLREHFKRRVQGANNAGEIPVLTGGAKWQPMDQSARDMDYMTSMKEAAKMIASVYGVPLPLIDNDASTFNNLREAKERLYTDTVLPMLRRLLNELGIWLLPRFGEGLQFDIDLDAIPALEGIRERKFKRTIEAVEKQVITREEGRIELGFDPKPVGEFVSRSPAPPQESKEAMLYRLAYG